MRVTLGVDDLGTLRGGGDIHYGPLRAGEEVVFRLAAEARGRVAVAVDAADRGQATYRLGMGDLELLGNGGSFHVAEGLVGLGEEAREVVRRGLGRSPYGHASFHLVLDRDELLKLVEGGVRMLDDLDGRYGVLLAADVRDAVRAGLTDGGRATTAEAAPFDAAALVRRLDLSTRGPEMVRNLIEAARERDPESVLADVLERTLAAWEADRRTLRRVRRALTDLRDEAARELAALGEAAG